MVATLLEGGQEGKEIKSKKKKNSRLLIQVLRQKEYQTKSKAKTTTVWKPNQTRKKHVFF